MYMREWLSWWSTTLPRSGSRVRVPSRALWNTKRISHRGYPFCVPRSSADTRRVRVSTLRSGRRKAEVPRTSCAVSRSWQSAGALHPHGLRTCGFGLGLLKSPSVGSAGKRSTGPFSISASPRLALRRGEGFECLRFAPVGAKPRSPGPRAPSRALGRAFLCFWYFKIAKVLAIYPAYTVWE